MFAELPAPACSGAVSVWVQLFAGLADSIQAQLGCSFPISTFQSLNGLERVLEIVSRLLDSLEQGGWSCRTWCTCLLQPCPECPMKCCHGSEWQCQTCAITISWLSSFPGVKWLMGWTVLRVLSCRAMESHGINESLAGMQSSDSFLGLLSMAAGHTHVPQQNRYSPKTLLMFLPSSAS